MVVAMAMIEVYFYFLVSVAALIALCAYWFPLLVYLNAMVLLAVLALQIVSIPLQLNWSRSNYGGLLRRQFFFVLYTAVIYGIHFHAGGVTASTNARGALIDALYFSLTTWTTLGYGDSIATPALRLATSLEALTGVVTSAVLTATIWLYCQERLSRPADSQQSSGLELQHDPVLGVWRQLDSQEAQDSSARRAKVVTLRSCPRCGRAPSLDRFFDIAGRLAPFPWFMAVCECGAHSRARRNAILAEYEWNRYGPVEPRPSNHFPRLYLFRLVMAPSYAVAFLRDVALDTLQLLGRWLAPKIERLSRR